MKYAKLSPPRLHSALPRQRLFALLDTMRDDHAVLWIAAPPGAGKSTLAASYIAARAGSAHWCQLDLADADPATLFYFLAEMIKDTGPALPWSMQGVESDRQRVERLFFRDFYARLAPGAIVVFDNVQDFDWSSGAELMSLAFSEVPEGITVMALSRDAPPERLARLELNGTLATIGWSELRLDAEEARTLAGLDAREGGEEWIDLVDGWVAGLVMLRNLGKHTDIAALSVPGERDAVFRYFAGEIFERMPAQQQKLLLLLSCLPGVTADDAELLTGTAEAGRMLGALYRDRLFIERRGDARFTYHFHALFREFLQHEARARLDPAERMALLEKAGAILDQQGRVDEAARLFEDAGAHQSLRGLMLRHAKAMLDAGRGQSWREWLSSLPPDLIEQEPMLAYWHGLSLSKVTPARARQILTRAEQAFASAGQARARLLAIAALIDSYDLEWRDVRALHELAQTLDAGLGKLAENEVDAEFALKMYSRMTLAWSMVAPDWPGLAQAAERALRILPSVESPVEQLAAGAILLRYFDGADKAGSALRLVSELHRLADDPGICPFHRARWYSLVASWHNRDGNYSAAEQVTNSAKHIVASFDLDPLPFQFLELHHMIGNGDLGAARALLDQIEQRISSARAADLVELYALEASWRSRSGEVERACEAMMKAISLSEEQEMPAPQRARLEGFVAACHTLLGQFDAARLWFERAIGHALGYEVVLANEAYELAMAYAQACGGHEAEAVLTLRPVLERHRARQASTLFVMLPRLASELAALALRHDIETEHIAAIIVRQRLSAPHANAPRWPWPVAVRTLGRLELSLSGRVVAASGKAQQRPLLLLKALVAAGERGKNQQSLAALLWPNADDPRSAMSVTVHRLRKLLVCEDIIGISAGNIQLIAAQSWSDLGALDKLCKRVDSLPEDTAAFELQAITVELLDLYRGPFCDGDDDSWMLPVRDTWRNRFLGAVAGVGLRLEGAGSWTEARALYQRALEAEPLAESMHRGLMRSFHAQGDSAAAFSAYRHCRETLSIILGRTPSPETDQLASTLGLKG
ncbi:MAG: BTAD domain-containing putative transcriptional regulator [Pseudomonadota bacterium]